MLYEPVVSSRVSLPLCKRCHVHVVAREDPFLGWDICPYCKVLAGAEAANTQERGKPSPYPPFSVEFELAAPFYRYDDLDRALVLLKYGFLRTRDGTVDEEYKSPIYRSWPAFEQVLPVLESLRDLVDERCGTHIHVSLPVKEQFRSLYRRVFEPFVKYLEERPQQTVAFWGRPFNEHAGLLLGEKFSCISICTRYDTLEFRLPRFHTAQQYFPVVRFCRMATHAINQGLRAWNVSPEQLGASILAFYRKALRQVHLDD